MYLLRYLLIFVVLGFCMFFFLKTLFTTRYFQNKRRLHNIARNFVFVLVSVIVAITALSIYISLES